MALVEWNEVQAYGATADGETVTFTEGTDSIDVTISGNEPDAFFGTLGYDNYNSYGYTYSGFSHGNGNPGPPGEEITFTMSESVGLIELSFGLVSGDEQYSIRVNGVQLTQAQLLSIQTAAGGTTVDVNGFIVDDVNENGIDASGGDAVFRFDAVALGFTNGIDTISVTAEHEEVDNTNLYATLGFSIDPTTIICFGKGTLLETALGPKAVEDLSAGDLVWTVDRGLVPIAWIGSTAIKRRDLGDDPASYPVRIPPGALGDNQPKRSLIVSPQHRVLVASPIVERMTGHQEVVVIAKSLVGVNGIEFCSEFDVMTYYHVLLPSHELLFSEGAMTESLLLGPQSRRNLEKTLEWPRIVEAMPALIAEKAVQTHEPVRPIVSRKKAEMLAYRHQKNRKSLVVNDFVTSSVRQAVNE